MAIKVERVLPPNLVITWAEDGLYDIGLCLTSVKREPKPRKLLLSKPIVIWTIQWAYLFARLASILIGNNNKQLALLLGDVGNYIGLPVQWNIILIFAILITITSQLNYYYNYKRGNNSIFLRVFQMMSGSVTPVSLGLYRVSDVRKLTKLRILFKIIKFNCEYVLRTFSFLFVLSLFCINEHLPIALTYGLLSAIIISTWTYISSTITLYQFLYFYILCTYLKIKIKNINETSNRIKGNKRFSKVQNILHSYDVVYREINEYNTTYWSKFIFIVWSIFGAIIAQNMFMVIFMKINILIRLLLCYSTFLILILFNFIFLISCSLNTEANKSYKIFNSLILLYSRSEKSNRMSRLKNILKVIFKLCNQCFKMAMYNF